MKLIATVVATLALLFGGAATLAPAAMAGEGDVAQFCVDFPGTGDYSPHLAEDYDTWEAMRGRFVTPFVNSPQGCSGLSAGYGDVWDSVNPFAPADDGSTCEPSVRTVEVPVVKTVTVAVADPALVKRVERQRATIKRLRAKIRRIR